MSAADAGVPREARRVPRWVLTLLIASLAFNLLVIGLIGGAVWRFHALASGDASGPSINLAGYAGALPLERRRDLWAKTAAERHELRSLREDLRRKREEFVGALTAAPFDREQFAAAQARLLEADRKARAAAHRLYAQIAVALTPEERRAFRSWRPYRGSARAFLDEAPDAK
jgi:uncharacterized membrane protein